MESRLGELRQFMHCDVQVQEERFLKLDQTLSEALKNDKAEIAIEAKSQLGVLNEEVTKLYESVRREYIAVIMSEGELPGLLKQLDGLSPTQAKLRGREANTIDERVKRGPNTVESLKRDALEFTRVGESISKDLELANTVIKEWETVKSNSNRQLETARTILPLEESQKFLERQRSAVANYELKHDALLDYKDLSQLYKDVERAMVGQRKSQGEFQEEKRTADKQLETYLKLASPSAGGAAMQKYSAANSLARVNKYAEARDGLRQLNTTLDEQIKGEKNAASEWETQRDLEVKAILSAIEQGKQKDGGKWAASWDHYYTAILKGDIDYTVWLGDHLRDYETAKQGLAEIKGERLARIQKEFEETDTAVDDAKKRLIPYDEHCEAVAKKIEQVVDKIGGDKTAAAKSLGDLPAEQRRASQLPRDSAASCGLKLGVPLEQALKEGAVLLEKLDERLDALLNEENLEGRGQLQGLVAERDLWELHQKVSGQRVTLEKEWKQALDAAQTALDEFAQIGGVEYSRLLGELEKREQEAADAGQKFKEYLALFPQADAVEKNDKWRLAALEGMVVATSGLGPQFLLLVSQAQVAAGQELEKARKSFGTILDGINSELRKEKWLMFGNSASSEFRTRIRAESEKLAVYKDSDNLGAIESAAKVANGLLKQMTELLDKRNAQAFKEVVEKINSLKEKIDGETLKSCKKTLQEKLAKQFEGGTAVEARTLWHDEALALLVKFEKDLLTPALDEAQRIKTVRDQVPALHDKITEDLKKLAEKMNALIGKGFSFPVDPPNCGEFTKRLAALKQVLETNEVAGVVEGGFKRLEELAQQAAELLTKDEKDLEQVAVGAKKQLDDDEATEKDLAERKKKVLEELDKFAKTDFPLLKNVEKDSGRVEQAERLIDAAKKSAEADEVMSAEEQLRTLRRMAADARLTGEGKKTEKLASYAKDWNELVRKVSEQFVALRSEVDKQWRTDPLLDQQVLDDVIKKLPESPGIKADDLASDLEVIDDGGLPIPERKAARERLLKSLRHNYAELTNNPIYAHLRENAFGQPVGTAALVQFLANFETKVLTTL